MANDPKARAAAKLREPRERVRGIRRTVVAVAVTLFLALWAVIFTTLVTGHDPVIADKAQGVANTGPGFTTTSSGSTSSSSSNSSGSNTSSVTTRQS